MLAIKKLFNPNSVAVIGASDNQQKIGHLILKNLIEFGFKGKIYPVNPKAKTILNQKVFPSILAIPTPPDLAIIVVPAKIVPQVLEETGQSGTKIAIIISAGFAETGRRGQENQEQLLTIAQKYHLRILGPNCLGVISPQNRLNASWGEVKPRQGNIAFMSQSGALAGPIIELIDEANLGFSYFASLGNKSDIDEADLLELFSHDPRTNLIIAYLESFKNGQKLSRLAQKITPQKPLVILKSGQTDLGAQSAQSHTASLATPEKITEGVFKQANIIGVENITQLVDLTKLITKSKNKTLGKKIALLTNAGGPGVLATDSVAKNQLSIAQLEPRTSQKLADIFPKEASFANPIDILGNANDQDYLTASQVLLADQNVDVLIIILTKQRGTNAQKIAQKIAAIKTNKLIITLFIGGKSLDKAREIINQNKLICFSEPEEAITLLAKLANYQEKAKSKIIPIVNKLDRKKLEPLFSNQLDEANGLKILSRCQVNTPRNITFTNEKEGMEALGKLGLPTFLKVLSPKLNHKTELGAVKKIDSKNEFVAQFNIMKKKFYCHRFILAEEIRGEIELIVGIKRDQSFGHLLMVGAGGIYTEILKDRSFRSLPVTKNDIKDMLSELKIYPILKGARGKKSVNLPELEKTILAISQLVNAFPKINQLDINPLIVGQKATAVDIKISLDRVSL